MPALLAQLMGAFALYERRWRERAAWLAAVLTFAVAMTFHAQAVWTVMITPLLLVGLIFAPGALKGLFGNILRHRQTLAGD